MAREVGGQSGPEHHWMEQSRKSWAQLSSSRAAWSDWARAEKEARFFVQRTDMKRSRAAVSYTVSASSPFGCEEEEEEDSEAPLPARSRLSSRLSALLRVMSGLGLSVLSVLSVLSGGV